MIDKEILDAVLPLPTLDELKEQKVEELKDEGFVISNFHSGGVFYTMLMIVLRIKVEAIELLRVVLNNMFVSHAGGAWLDLKMADYSKKRKKAQKTQGFVTVSRTDMTGEAVKIPKGHVFKSILDINGEELRFFVLEAATLQKGASSVDVLVEAETEGSRYNVPAGQIVTILGGSGCGKSSSICSCTLWSCFSSAYESVASSSSANAHAFRIIASCSSEKRRWLSTRPARIEKSFFAAS